MNNKTPSQRPPHPPGKILEGKKVNLSIFTSTEIFTLDDVVVINFDENTSTLEVEVKISDTIVERQVLHGLSFHAVILT